MNRTELAGVVIYDNEGKLLLLHRNTPKLTQWELPGGKREENETHEEAARREAKEELGINVKIIRALGGTSFEYDGKNWRYEWFLAEILGSGYPTVCEPDMFDDLRHWSIQELKDTADPISANIAKFVEAFEKGV